MPETNTANPGTINRQDWRDDITLLEPQQTPFTSLVDKTDQASAMLVETFGDRLEPRRTAGQREGAPDGQGGNQLANIGRFGAYQHFSQRKWGVTHHQKLIAQRGGLAGVSNAAERSRTRSELELKLDVEAVNCSNLETQDGGGGTAAMQTRGAFRWLDPTGALTPTVAASFRSTAASQLLHGNNSGMLFPEDSLYAQLKELSAIRGAKGNYKGIFGYNVVETMDKLSRIATTSVTANPATAQSYTVRQGADEFTINLMVNIYNCSFGQLEVIPTVANLWSDTTNSGDPNAGLVLDMELWYLDMLENINEASTSATATVECGTWQTTWVNICRSPRGNGRIQQS